MRKFQHLLLVFALIILGATSALAVPAYPNPIEFTQPDGKKITIILKGDEKIKWAQTLDGYSLLFNKEGYYEYAIINDKGDMVPSGVRVNDPSKQSNQEKSLLEKLNKGYFYSDSQVKLLMDIWNIKEKEGEKGFPTTGNRSLICILVGFSDKSFTKTQAEFNNLFNQVGYTTGGATGSVKDYYLENSYNQFNLTVDVAGPYTVSQNMAYYGANDVNGNDVLPRAMVSEAVVLADGDVNFANYDNDNNNIVDGVYVIFAGYGEEAGGPANAIWSHASSISPVIVLDGKTISKYSCSPELRDNYGTNITRIGVICHEFGHVLGAKDYYDTNYETGGEFDGTGNWDMMANGSWNNGGATPAHHNGYTKVYVYNWATATELATTPLNVELQNAEENSNSFYRISTTTANEFFLIENRYKHKFDAYIPGSGMIIYHAKNISIMGNAINATHPQGMYPVSANATMEPTSTPSSYGSINSSTCAWPTASKTAFTDTSVPSSKSWAGANTAKPITGITRNATDKTVSFLFMGGAPAWPTNFVATPISNSQISLSWSKTNNKDVLLAYSTTGVFGEPGSINYTASSTIDGGGTVIYAGGLETFNHTSLAANTKYYYKIWSKINTVPTWSTGTEVNAATQPCTLIEAFPYEEYFNGATVPTCWSVIPTVATHTWQLTTGYTVSSIPVAPVNGTHFFYCPWNLSQNQNELLTLPSYNLTLLENPYLKFSFNGSYTAAVTNNKCDLKVLVKVNGESWTTIWEEANHPEFTSSAANYQWLLTQLDLSEYKEQSNVQFAFQYTGKAGSNFAIDDVQVYNFPTSISSTIKDYAVTMFPNPFQSELRIKAEFEIEKLTIVSISGQVIATYIAANQREEVFNLNNLHPGSYFISITGKNGQKVNRMVVKQ